MSKIIPFLICILLLVLVSCVSQVKQGDAVWLESRADAGMFAVLGDVVSTLECYDSGFCSGIKIDFGTDGLYFDQSKGPNWFNYYFFPLTLGAQPKTYLRTDNPQKNGLWNPDNSKGKVTYLIQKYLKLKPDIEHEINQFVEQYFKNNFIIGIHYRGTDKYTEAPTVKYERASSEISKQILRQNLQNYKIFVATDEYDFLEYLKAHFSGRIIYLPNIERSKDGKPLHMGKSGGQYETGKQALIDCMLLSKTHLLIRTSSNLSLFSTYLNPKLQVVELNQRF